MIKVAISQRVSIVKEYNERRDCLDQRWFEFLRVCGIVPLIIPNNLEVSGLLLKEVPVDGIILTGGNSLASYGGDALERDELELMLVEYAKMNLIPLIGVCRGMQVIQHYFGVKLEQVAGHILKRQVIKVNGKPFTTNSYHSMGTSSTVNELAVWAQADDGVVKAIRHTSSKMEGIMWHPERNEPFDVQDILFFRSLFCHK